MAIPNAVRCTVNINHSGVLTAQNVYHLSVASLAVVNQTFADDVAGVWDSAITTAAILQDLSNTVTIQSLTIQDLRVDNAFPLSSVLIRPGTGSTDLLPRGVSLLYMLRVFARPPGRTFLWGYTEGANNPSGNPLALVTGRSALYLREILDNLPLMTTPANLAVLNRASQTVGDVVQVDRPASTVAGGWSQQCRRRRAVQI